MDIKVEQEKKWSEIKKKYRLLWVTSLPVELVEILTEMSFEKIEKGNKFNLGFIYFKHGEDNLAFGLNKNSGINFSNQTKLKTYFSGHDYYRSKINTKETGEKAYTESIEPFLNEMEKWLKDDLKNLS